MTKIFRFSDAQIKIEKNKWRIDLTDIEGNSKEKNVLFRYRRYYWIGIT